jgi:hypothetical protein
MSLTKFVGLLAGSTLTLTGVSYGATEANNDTATQISELKAEIAQLKAQQGEQWLTEQRAAQVRGIVQDVLADADTRASLQNTAATSGYDNGFFISSADGNFKLKVTALEQVRFVYNSTYNQAISPENSWGFENRRTQVWFTGNVVDPTWTYALGLTVESQTDPYYQTPAPGGFALGYAYVRKTWKNSDSQFYVQGGQFSAPWTLESTLWSAGQTQMGEFSAFEYMFGVGLTTGILAGWQNDFLRVQGSWSNNLDPYVSTLGAGYGTQSWNSPFNTGVALAARGDIKLAGTWDQFSTESSFRGEEFGAKIGVGFMYQNGRTSNFFVTPASPLGVTVDGAIDFGGANIIAQFGYMDDTIANGGNQWGFNVQGGFFITDDLELFGSWTYASVDTGVAPGRTEGSVIQFGGNWYFAKNNCKATLGILMPMNVDAGVPLPPGMGLNAAGQNNLSVTAQLQVTF